MKAHRSIARTLLPLLAACCTVLLACARTDVQSARGDDGTTAIRSETAESLTALKKDLEATLRYASRMEELYASQEAEILALRAEVAKLRGQ